MPVDWRGRHATDLNVDDQTDQTSFVEVFLPHLDDAFRLARWISGSRADAEDIVQEASLRAFKGIRTFSGGSTRAWTLTIVRNASYSWLAKNRPSAVVLTEDLDQRAREEMERGAEDGDVPTPEAALIAKMEAEEVRNAVATLPLLFREILVLREIHDLDYRSIAEIIRVPIGTVMSRLARARKLIFATLRESAR
jgi:RNA polymerase sigma-70 factor (ECF subfamily)